MERDWSGPNAHRELVQIGAVRLDSRFARTASLDLIVRPTINPVLSEYLVNLTRITQERVDRDGCSFAEALATFERFLMESATYFNRGYDSVLGGDDSVLQENLDLNSLSRPLPPVEFLDIQPWIQTALGCKGEFITSSDVLARVGSSERFPSHDAVGDATSVAVAIRHLKSKGAPPLPHEIPGK